MEARLAKLLELWNKGMLGKLVLFVLLPLVVLAFGFKLYREYQVMRAKQSLKDTEKKGEKLEKEKQEALDKADKAEAKADALAEKRKKNEVSDDWHLEEDE